MVNSMISINAYFFSIFQECFNWNHYINKSNKPCQHELIFLFTNQKDANGHIRKKIHKAVTNLSEISLF